MQLIIILIGILLAVFILKKTLVSIAASAISSNSTKKESMKGCLYCNLHVPESEGIYEDENFFCKQAHFEKWQQEQNTTNN